MIYQPVFDIPTDIALKIATGEYVLCGSVVRKSTGQIVKHLKPIEVNSTSEAALSIGQKAIRFAKANPAIVALGAAAIVSIGVYAYVKISSEQERSIEIDTSGLNSALTAYIQSLQDRNLTIAVIDELLEEIDSISELGTVTIELTSDQLKLLFTSIREYTVKLVEGNAEQIAGIGVSIPSESGETLSDLKSYLLVQKAVLKAA